MLEKRLLKLGLRFAAVCAVAFPLAVWGCYGYINLRETETDALVADLGDFAIRAKSLDEEKNYVNQIVEVLRERGQESVDAMVRQRLRIQRRTIRSRVVRPQDSSGAVELFDQLIDRVARQRHASSSKLFWYDSLELAKQQAEESGKPILSLRMLGNLDEEMSCANSRLFRTVLYPDPNIADEMRENFVLHWQSVRDVPKVTIDFGDGRMLDRPLTGNSLHMIMNSDGRPLDVLPGLVSPESFSGWLDRVSKLHEKTKALSGDDLVAGIVHFHRERSADRREQSDLAIKENENVTHLNSLDPRWEQLAERFRVNTLSEQSEAMLMAKRPKAEPAMALTISKGRFEAPILKVVRNLGPSIARDTAFNLYGLQPKIDDMFVSDASVSDAEALVKRIYTEAFLMPLDDLWLGLSPAEEFVAIENGGRRTPNESQLNSIQQAVPVSVRTR